MFSTRCAAPSAIGTLTSSAEMTVPAPTVIARLNVCGRLTAVATAPSSLLANYFPVEQCLRRALQSC
jgi:hypothetical protein